MNPFDAMNAINDGRWADLNAWLENNPDAWPTFHASDDQSHGALMVLAQSHGERHAEGLDWLERRFADRATLQSLASAEMHDLMDQGAPLQPIWAHDVAARGWFTADVFNRLLTEGEIGGKNKLPYAHDLALEALKPGRSDAVMGIVARMAQAGVDVNQHGKREGDAPMLSHAVTEGAPELVRALLNAGADPTRSFGKPQNPIDHIGLLVQFFPDKPAYKDVAAILHAHQAKQHVNDVVRGLQANEPHAFCPSPKA